MCLLRLAGRRQQKKKKKKSLGRGSAGQSKQSQGATMAASAWPVQLRTAGPVPRLVTSLSFYLPPPPPFLLLSSLPLHSLAPSLPLPHHPPSSPFPSSSLLISLLLSASLLPSFPILPPHPCQISTQPPLQLKPSSSSAPSPLSRLHPFYVLPFTYRSSQPFLGLVDCMYDPLHPQHSVGDKF